MAQILKPTNLSLTWASGGDVLNPGDTKYATGWQVEIPPRQWFNYLDNRQDTAIAHINQHGIPVWDSSTEYQYGVSGVKSLVMGSDGTVYRAKQTNTGQDPTTDVTDTYWEIAFANTGDFYTKVQSDANYLAKASNLSDLPNVATARANLSVYSQTETYTKVEVDNKTTVASAAQAQAQLSNTTLLTPLRFADAFKGANQSLGTSGFQKIGNFLVQWGWVSSDGVGVDTTWVFPQPFGTAVLNAWVTPNVQGANHYASITSVLSGSNTQLTFRSTAPGPGTSFHSILVIGM